jgi:hypothetical protein
LPSFFARRASIHNVLATGIGLAIAFPQLVLAMDAQEGTQMNILIFRLTDADGTWYVWPCNFPQLYSFGSNTDAQHFASQLAKAQEGTLVQMERSIEQAATLI